LEWFGVPTEVATSRPKKEPFYSDLALRELNRVLCPGGLLIVANLDIHALMTPLRVLLIARTLYYAKREYRRAMPRVSPKRMLSARMLCTKLECAGFRVESLEQIRDRSCVYNCPIDYVRAVKQ
jgi:hypothetical protein